MNITASDRAGLFLLDERSMKTSFPDLPDLLSLRALSEAIDTAVSAAHAGAAILQAYSHRRGDLVIDHKAQNDLVSQADREAEEAIISVLRERTPDFGIVAEETGGRPEGKATWCIDPLDGTTNYLHGIPHYAVSIALVAHDDVSSDGQENPIVAVVYDPNREELFTAVQGIGAWLNGRRISVSRSPSLDQSVLATGFPFRDFSFEAQYMPMLHDAIHSTRGIRRIGAAALDLAWTACGRFDGYWEMGLAPWDVAAGTLLVREAGGLADDMYGREPWARSGNIVAGNKAVARSLQALVTPHLDHASPASGPGACNQELP